MSAVDLATQLTTLSESLQTTNTLINRLAKLTFQPGTEPLNDERNVRVELAQDIHDSLKQLEEEIEYLQQEAEDIKADGEFKRGRGTRGDEEARLSAKVARVAEEITHSRQQFRNAQIAAKFASEEAKRKEREAVIEGYRKEAERLVSNQPAQGSTTTPSSDLLFANRSKKTQQQKQLTKDEVLVHASGDVTAALRRTHALLSTELSRSRFAQETFDESTTALAQLGEEYSNLDNILSNSRNLLGTLLRSQKSDTWYLETAFYILLATLCWLFFRRVLFGPFVKLPLFLWKVFSLVLYWLLVKPFLLFLSVTGVVTSERATKVSRNLASSSRAPLIVQLSAQGGPQAFESGKIPVASVPAGAGGAGAKIGKDSVLEGTMSEQIGKMAEESAEQDQQTPQQQQEEQKQEKEPVRRGDGTILQERGDIPPNPKKKAFDANVEDAKHEARKKRDEL